MKSDLSITKELGVGEGSNICRNVCRKAVILTFVGNYLPGYKAGGILRTITNTVDHLSDEFEFRLVTRDRDLGDNKPYSDIKINQWQQVGNAMVYYLALESNTIKEILNLIVSTPHDVVYLNSFFDPLTIKVLLIKRLRTISFKPVIVAPLGEFAWASLKQKYLKKYVFIQASRILGLYNKVTWRASSELEMLDIIKVMKINPDVIHVALDLPNKVVAEARSKENFQQTHDGEGLNLVFLSRISREKNLDYALKVLNKVNAKIFFDIYGPTENAAYWKECQKIISQLPDNIIVKYSGSVSPNEVQNIFSRYDLFLFPTAGENYGHVIAESLTAGTPVLISTETPWRNLQADGLGWDIDLKQIDSFAEIIDRLASLNNAERLSMRNLIKNKIKERLLDTEVLTANRQLFRRAISR